jgi:hypothetical protein
MRLRWAVPSTRVTRQLLAGITLSALAEGPGVVRWRDAHRHRDRSVVCRASPPAEVGSPGRSRLCRLGPRPDRRSHRSASTIGTETYEGRLGRGVLGSLDGSVQEADSHAFELRTAHPLTTQRDAPEVQ